MSSYYEINTDKIPGYQPVSTRTTSNNDLSGEAFMELLLVQMRNQSPLEPMKDTEMISQMAALNSLQELQEINKSLSSSTQSNQFLAATNLIGKEVTYQTGSDEDTQEKSGTVSSVMLESGKILLVVDSEKVTLDSLVSVKESE